MVDKSEASTATWHRCLSGAIRQLRFRSVSAVARGGTRTPFRLARRPVRPPRRQFRPTTSRTTHGPRPGGHRRRGAAGPGVDTPNLGTRVTVFPNPGSWAQRINVAAEVAVPVPDSVSDDVAAQMVCNPLTALLLYRAAQQHFSVGVDGIVINNAAGPTRQPPRKNRHGYRENLVTVQTCEKRGESSG